MLIVDIIKYWNMKIKSNVVCDERKESIDNWIKINQ